jgi:hypothetical protein
MPYWGKGIAENDQPYNLYEDFKSQMVGAHPRKEAAVMEISRYFNKDNVIYAEWLEDRQEFGFVEVHIPDSKSEDYPSIILPILGLFKLLMDDVKYGRYINRRHAFIVKKYAKRLLKNPHLKGRFKPSLRKFIKNLNRQFGLLKKHEEIRRRPASMQWITDEKNYLESIKYKRIKWESEDAESQFKRLKIKQYSYVELEKRGEDIVILIWKNQKGKKLELIFTGKKAVDK